MHLLTVQLISHGSDYEENCGKQRSRLELPGMHL